MSQVPTYGLLMNMEKKGHEGRINLEGKIHLASFIFILILR